MLKAVIQCFYYIPLLRRAVYSYADNLLYRNRHTEISDERQLLAIKLAEDMARGQLMHPSNGVRPYELDYEFTDILNRQSANLQVENFAQPMQWIMPLLIDEEDMEELFMINTEGLQDSIYDSPQAPIWPMYPVDGQIDVEAMANTYRPTLPLKDGVIGGQTASNFQKIIALEVVRDWRSVRDMFIQREKAVKMYLQRNPSQSEREAKEFLWQHYAPCQLPNIVFKDRMNYRQDKISWTYLLHILVLWEPDVTGQSQGDYSVVVRKGIDADTTWSEIRNDGIIRQTSLADIRSENAKIKFLVYLRDDESHWLSHDKSQSHPEIPPSLHKLLGVMNPGESVVTIPQSVAIDSGNQATKMSSVTTGETIEDNLVADEPPGISLPPLVIAESQIPSLILPYTLRKRSQEVGAFSPCISPLADILADSLELEPLPGPVSVTKVSTNIINQTIYSEVDKLFDYALPELQNDPDLASFDIINWNDVAGYEPGPSQTRESRKLDPFQESTFTETLGTKQTLIETAETGNVGFDTVSQARPRTVLSQPRKAPGPRTKVKVHDGSRSSRRTSTNQSPVGPPPTSSGIETTFINRKQARRMTVPPQGIRRERDRPRSKVHDSVYSTNDLDDSTIIIDHPALFDAYYRTVLIAVAVVGGAALLTSLGIIALYRYSIKYKT